MPEINRNCLPRTDMQNNTSAMKPTPDWKIPALQRKKKRKGSIGGYILPDVHNYHRQEDYGTYDNEYLPVQ